MAGSTSLWHQYPSEIEGAASRTTVDLLALDPEHRVEGAESLIAFGFEMNEPGADGSGSHGERERLDQLKNDVEASLSESTPRRSAQAVGTLARQGLLQLFLHAQPQAGADLIPGVLERIVAHGWASPWVHAEKDQDWSHYASLLLPRSAVRIEAINARCLAAYGSAGQDLGIARQLTHALRFPSEPAADLALESLNALDFELAGTPKAFGPVTRVKVRRTDPLDHVPALTMMLSELCAPYDGDHLSWIATG